MTEIKNSVTSSVWKISFVGRSEVILNYKVKEKSLWVEKVNSMNHFCKQF